MNQPATNQGVVQLCKVINEGTNGIHEGEELGRADLVDLVDEAVEEFPEKSQWLAQTYQPEIYSAEVNRVEYVGAVILGITSSVTFFITAAGTNCNILSDTVASQSCLSEHFYKQLILPLAQQIFCFSETSASGNILKPLVTVKCQLWLGGYSFSVI